MKNVSIALNAVLLVAVAVLFYFQFSSPKKEDKTDVQSVPSRVAYISTDSILKYYEYTKINNEKLQNQAKRLQDDLRSRAISLQGEINDYQRNRNSLTIGQAQAVEEGLARKEQNYRMAQETATQQVMEEQEKLSRDLYNKITGFLKTYSEEHDLQAVLKYDASSDLLFAHQTIDITQQVIEGLNAQYKAGDNPVKKDTTTTKK